MNLSTRDRTPLNEAQDLIYAAWEARSPKRAIELARKALAISRDCADAYVILAEQASPSIDEALEMYRDGVRAGERALGRKFFKENAGHFWGILESRPYMRARFALAELLWLLRRRYEAVEHFQDMLRLNPDDNQGIRDILLPRLLELGRNEEAERLLTEYSEDAGAVWAYSRALLGFRKSGDSPDANASLAEALATNPHVPDYLLTRKYIPDDLPDIYGFGDDDEAILYADESLGLWTYTPGALEWLAVKVAKIQ